MYLDYTPFALFVPISTADSSEIKCAFGKYLKDEALLYLASVAFYMPKGNINKIIDSI